ncbi:unnamed protein product, partial [Mesorhabditis belari]|uniref:Uncharacterized protein n=1 Tax=Mesorhabditis belari TaxID=2138241 RepID=A0AAF3F4Q8_9BILA
MIMEVKPYTGGTFQKIGSEESHTVETYERKIHGTESSEPSEPVRPVSPVSPVMPVGELANSDLLRPVEPLRPLSIPRIELKKNTPSPRSPKSPRSLYYGDELVADVGERRSISPRSVRSGPISPRSNASGGSVGSQSAIPMKKVITKKRLVSIHDGRPISPFVETITWEPAYPDRYSSSSRHSSRAGSRQSGSSTGSHHHGGHRILGRSDSECAYLIENPLYRD